MDKSDAGNNPINAVDPYGLIINWGKVFGGAVSTFGGLISIGAGVALVGIGAAEATSLVGAIFATHTIGTGGVLIGTGVFAFHHGMLTFFKGLDDFDLRYEEIKRKAKEEAEIKACKEWEEFEATFNYIKKTMDEIENRRQNTPTYWER